MKSRAGIKINCDERPHHGLFFDSLQFYRYNYKLVLLFANCVTLHFDPLTKSTQF